VLSSQQIQQEPHQHREHHEYHLNRQNRKQVAQNPEPGAKRQIKRLRVNQKQKSNAKPQAAPEENQLPDPNQEVSVNANWVTVESKGVSKNMRKLTTANVKRNTEELVRSRNTKTEAITIDNPKEGTT